MNEIDTPSFLFGLMIGRVNRELEYRTTTDRAMDSLEIPKERMKEICDCRESCEKFLLLSGASRMGKSLCHVFVKNYIDMNNRKVDRWMTEKERIKRNRLIPKQPIGGYTSIGYNARCMTVDEILGITEGGENG